MKSITRTLLLLSVIGLTAASPIEHEALDTGAVFQATEDYRLTRDVVPISYELEVTPHFVAENGKEQWTFDGVVFIVVKTALTDVKSITLHQKNLKISEFMVGSETGTYNEAQYNPITDKWTIPLNTALTPNVEVTLKVVYTGVMAEDMNGFYRSYYMEGTTKVMMASTQFQQTEARRAFPCFDEPGFRSTFTLTVNRPADMNTISNTRRNAAKSSAIKDVFETTPKMSSYLLAFIVSKYEGNTATKVGVYARPAAKAQTELASTFGASMMDEFGTYLGLDYYTAGIPKMDMAAIPDFSAGAMENWGLLTYRETNILYYPNDTPSINQQRIVAVIAHEQAHQWFGDLVTCNFWSETWLNEGFARYFQYFGTKRISGYADWDLEEQFVVENLQQSMQLDSTEDTHPMTDPTVKSQAQSSAMFDNISYNKAASIIRMLSYVIGAVPFQNTLKKYLADNKANEFGVEPSALFAAIDEITPETSTWLSPWTTKSGFPLVTVELKDNTLNLSQKRFMRNGIQHSLTDLYNIPITISIDSSSYDNHTPLLVLTDAQKTHALTEAQAPKKYYILNPKQTGFYRVNYDTQNWLNIKEALMKEGHDNIHVMNRAQVVDDLFNLARGGVVNYDVAVDIIRYIKKEKHYIPWLSAINNGLTFLSQRVKGSSSDSDQQVFAWFVNDLMEDVYKHLGFEPKDADRQTEKYNRANILAWTCKYGHEECIKSAKESFAKFKADPINAKVHKDQRTFVYCNAIRHGDAADFDFLYDRFLTTDISAEQLNQLIGMGCTKDAVLVKKYLDRVINTEDIRPQDRASAINNVLNSNIEGPQLLYNYITANSVAWMAKMGSLGTLSTVAGRFTQKKQFEDYEAWLDTKTTELGAAHATLKASSTKSRENLVWDDKYMKEFMDHLTKLKSSAPAKVISIFISVISVAVLYILN